MITWAVAWVMVQALKQDREMEFSALVFVLTGIIDALTVLAVLYALDGKL